MNLKKQAPKPQKQTKTLPSSDELASGANKSKLQLRKRKELSRIFPYLPMISLTISAIAIIVAIISNNYASKANQIAEEANALSQNSNKTAEEANTLASQANKALLLQISPHLEIVDASPSRYGSSEGCFMFLRILNVGGAPETITTFMAYVEYRNNWAFLYGDSGPPEIESREWNGAILGINSFSLWLNEIKPTVSNNTGSQEINPAYPFPFTLSPHDSIDIGAEMNFKLDQQHDAKVDSSYFFGNESELTPEGYYPLTVTFKFVTITDTDQDVQSSPVYCVSMK